MNIEELYKYIEENKDKGILNNAKLSACRNDGFQISLIDNNPYKLSNIHFEVIRRNDKIYFEIHFEENDTTRYYSNEQLQNIAKDNDFEWFEWWLGNGNNNSNNKSLRLKQDIVNSINNNKEFLELIEKKHKIFNNLLVSIAKKEPLNINTQHNIEEHKETKVRNIVKNIIFYGVAGVGKTHNTNKLINLIESGKDEKEIFDIIKENENSESLNISTIKDRVRFITFHQSFGYEDFIEGFRPNEDGEIKLVNGIFKDIALEAIENKAKNYYLIIDEINRGNISKIFGELITLIEESKRDDLEVVLPYSKEPFKIPSNLYIIRTMNSSDKSIALIDIALRRRFIFLKMKPKDELVPQNSRELFKKLNKYIYETLGEDKMIGHSYFMSGSDLDFVLEYQIKPLLEEYFYGDSERLDSALEIIGKSQ